MIDRQQLEEWLLEGVIMSAAPSRLLLGWGKAAWHPRAEENRASYYFPDYFLKDSCPWLAMPHGAEVGVDDFAAVLQKLAIDFSERPPSVCRRHWQCADRELFESTFHELQHLFVKGELVKAVPFVASHSQQPMTLQQRIASLASALKQIGAHPSYLYGYWNAEGGLLGATPEILFSKVTDYEWQTMACAGTRAADGQNLAGGGDQKETKEHGLVIEGIKSALLSQGRVDVGDLSWRKYASLMHLVTPIALHFDKPKTFDDLVAMLHPTPAVGAFPREAGMKWLRAYEQKIARGRFAAPVGFCLPDKSLSSCYVAIRNMQWDKTSIVVFAGCGLVAGSQCDKEWEEICLKLRAIKEMMALC